MTLGIVLLCCIVWLMAFIAWANPTLPHGDRMFWLAYFPLIVLADVLLHLGHLWASLIVFGVLFVIGARKWRRLTRTAWAEAQRTKNP